MGPLASQPNVCVCETPWEPTQEWQAKMRLHEHPPAGDGEVGLPPWLEDPAHLSQMLALGRFVSDMYASMVGHHDVDHGILEWQRPSDDYAEAEPPTDEADIRAVHGLDLPAHRPGGAKPVRNA